MLLTSLNAVHLYVKEKLYHHTAEARAKISAAVKSRPPGTKRPGRRHLYVWREGRCYVRDQDDKLRRRSRVMMEQLIGRPLNKNEVVHHKNENKADDRPENLELMTEDSHKRLHRLGSK